MTLIQSFINQSRLLSDSSVAMNQAAEGTFSSSEFTELSTRCDASSRYRNVCVIGVRGWYIQQFCGICGL